jgi:hypothetical protein
MLSVFGDIIIGACIIGAPICIIGGIIIIGGGGYIN